MPRYSRTDELSGPIAETGALIARDNYVGPVRCLPVEILSRCFHFLAAADPPVYTIYTGGSVFQPTEIALGWIKVRIERYISGSAFCSGMASSLLLIIGHPCMSSLEASWHRGRHSLAKSLIFCNEAHLLRDDTPTNQGRPAFDHLQATDPTICRTPFFKQTV